MNETTWKCSCGRINKPEANFCGTCGTKKPTESSVFCTNCGAKLFQSDRFCIKCGHAVDIQPINESTPQASPNGIVNAKDTVVKKNYIGKCYRCFSSFSIGDESERIACPRCKNVADAKVFINFNDDLSRFGKRYLAELPYLHDNDEFYLGGGYDGYSWNVLSIDNGVIFAILSNKKRFKHSDRGDSKSVLTYNSINSPVTWETCSLRKWLNEFFFNERFSEEEQACIVPAKVINNNNPFYGTPGGNDTVDRVFCLSIDELKYFCTDEKREEILGMTSSDSESYWLRSPGKQPNEASVNTAFKHTYDGTWDPNESYAVNRDTNKYYDESINVRPCICINTQNIRRYSRTGISNKTELKSLKVGDRFVFGFDEFIGPIKWRVISKDNGKVLILSEDVIRYKQFFKREDPFFCTWETSDIRKWLNTDFYQNFFNVEEKGCIITSVIKNTKTKFLQQFVGGDNTLDKVFLLSLDEADSLFPVNEDRNCKCKWWLRTSGDYKADGDNDSYAAADAFCVQYGGYISKYSESIRNFAGIRPAMWIRIDN